MGIGGVIVFFGVLGTVGPAALLFLLTNKVLTRFITNKGRLELGQAILFWFCVVLLAPIIWLLNKNMCYWLLFVPLGIWGFAWLCGKILDAIISGIGESINATNSARQAAQIAPVVADHLRNGNYRSARFPTKK